ncbi:MAG: hypothetical protein HYY28_09420 [Betaproteobacteria bacterium]|nr:hypothetical protein [Betaproteobacteria bacterium]
MKTTAISDRKLRRAAAEVETQIRELFGRCPELTGFAIKDLALMASEDIAAPDGEPKLFVTDIGFSGLIGEQDLEEAYTQIGTAISDVVSERPEAFELLRGRTFARTLH